MAGTLTLTRKINFPYSKNRGYILDWTATAGGVVTESISDAIGSQDGVIVAMETSPGALGDRSTNLPTALYDITIDDEYAADVAGGTLANRSGTVAERVNPSPGIRVWSPLDLNLSNAGVSTQGRLIIVISED